MPPRSRRLPVERLSGAGARNVTCKGHDEQPMKRVPRLGWDITGAGDANIQGFATDISVNRGGTVYFKIDVNPAASIRLDIYRMGYYQGLGAHQIIDSFRSRHQTRGHSRRAGATFARLPGWSTAGTGSSRHRGRFRRPQRRASTSPRLVRTTTPPARATSSSWCATTPARPKFFSRPRTPRGRRTTRTGATACIRGVPRPRLQSQLQPSLHHTRVLARGLGLQRRIPDGPLARGEWVRRELLYGRGRGPFRRGAAGPGRHSRPQGLPVGRPRRVLVRQSAGQRRSRARRGRASRVLQRQRNLLEDPIREQIDSGPPAAYRTLVSYKETHDTRS